MWTKNPTSSSDGGPGSGDPAAGLARRHVVVVGAGGLGCPALLALAEAGVGRLTVLDPDRVEPSNLPRQVLFGPEDVGQSKAEVAARAVARPGLRIHARPRRLDETNEDEVLDDADLVLDATDGARTKDWLNLRAVARRLPLIHAAALGAEGRLLAVRAGGRPCLACLFGRLEDQGATCADHGVWNGVVGATGFLAAAAALETLWGREEADAAYRVLDVAGGRGTSLSFGAAPDCPVCGEGARPGRETLPAAPRCDAPVAPASPLQTDAVLDLRAESCPMNLLRARRAVEDLEAGAHLAIQLGPEGRESVPEGLRALGHVLLAQEARGDGLRLVVARGEVAPRRRLSRDRLLRFARQVVLPDLGEEGQQRILEARFCLVGRGPAFETAAVYLAAAGAGCLDLAGSDLGEVRALVDALDARSEGRVRPAQGDPADAVGYVDGRAGPSPQGSGGPRFAFGAGADAEGGPYVVRPVEPGATPRAGWTTAGAGKAVRRALGALLADRLLRAVGTRGAGGLDLGLAPSGRFVSPSPRA